MTSFLLSVLVTYIYRHLHCAPPSILPPFSPLLSDPPSIHLPVSLACFACFKARCTTHSPWGQFILLTILPTCSRTPACPRTHFFLPLIRRVSGEDGRTGCLLTCWCWNFVAGVLLVGLDRWKRWGQMPRLSARSLAPLPDCPLPSLVCPCPSSSPAWLPPCCSVPCLMAFILYLACVACLPMLTYCCLSVFCRPLSVLALPFPCCPVSYHMNFRWLFIFILSLVCVAVACVAASFHLLAGADVLLLREGRTG